MVLVHVHCFHQPTNKTTHTQSTQTKPTVHTQSTQTTSTIPGAIRPNETVGAVPACPPERPHRGVSIPKTHALCAGYLTMDAPLQDDTGGHIGAAPTYLHQTIRCAITQCTFDSSSVITHRGYTFDSAGSASATRPTLGNDVREEATPLGLYFFSSHIITTRGKWIIRE